VTAIKHAEQERLAREASQRNILVREVHHRIKNHLQGVIGLIDQLKIRQPAAADALEVAAGQISAIAVVHGLHSTTLSSEMRPHQLVLAIVDAVTRLSSVVIRCREDTDPSAVALKINERDIVAVALIINELLYNAIKYTATGGEIELTFGCRNSSFDVQVLNRPARLPPGFDFAADRALGTGLTLVASLLPRQGACLSFDQRGDAVMAHLTLSPPCAMTAPIGNDDKENKT
jgi:two-component sensor histidine kinase